MATQDNAIIDSDITVAQDDYIAFVAVGGIIPSENSAGQKMTVEQFAAKYDVNPSTLWRWRQSIPDFWDRVAAKRREIGSKDRLSNVWNGIYLKAAAGNAEAAKLYLKNFDPNYIDPSTKVELDVGTGLSDLIAAHNIQQIKERNVIDVTPSPSE